jgi:hypothetical protein
MGRACRTHVEKRKVDRVLVGKPEGKRPLRRHIHRWEDNITECPKRLEPMGILFII